MLASYVLSFTVVPAFARQLLKDEHHRRPRTRQPRAGARGWPAPSIAASTVSATPMAARWRPCCCAGSSSSAAVAVLIAVTGALVPVVGTDFFPAADVGIIKLHVRAPRGNRLEGTEQIMAAVEDRIREIIPPKELRTINDTIGVPGGAQPRLRAERQRQRRRRRDADLAQRAAQAVGVLSQDHPREAGGGFPGHDLLFPDRRHREPGAEFRPVGADRHPDPGSEPQARLCGRPEAAADDQAHPRRGRPAHHRRCWISRPCRSTSTASAPRSSASRNATSPTTC